MKKKLLGLCVALSVSGAATAAGPFANLSALITYWNGTSTGGSQTNIYVDGTKVFNRSGFGPAYEEQYFQCYQTSDIRNECQVGDIASSDEHLSHQVAKFPSGATIYYNGSLYRSGDPGLIAHLISCTGDSSYYHPGYVKYYATESWYDGWLPSYSGSC